MKHLIRSLVILTALLLTLCLLPAVAPAEANETETGSDWISFLLICNEGMNNDKGNAGNTLLVACMNPVHGQIRLMMFTWDTFVNMEGYDVPQKLDMPYRNNGPEEAMKVFNENFGLNINHFLSLNYLNMASLIDEYGGIYVEITPAERDTLLRFCSVRSNSIKFSLLDIDNLHNQRQTETAFRLPELFSIIA